jgi:hypothetical protein
MSRFLTTRRSEWVPGLAILATAVGIGSLIGVSLGQRSWLVYVGLIALVLLGVGLLERLLSKRRAPEPPRARGRLRIVQGVQKAPYDLATDDRTDSQRYLM